MCVSYARVYVRVSACPPVCACVSECVSACLWPSVPLFSDFWLHHVISQILFRILRDFGFLRRSASLTAIPSPIQPSPTHTLHHHLVPLLILYFYRSGPDVYRSLSIFRFFFCFIRKPSSFIISQGTVHDCEMIVMIKFQLLCVSM